MKQKNLRSMHALWLCAGALLIAPACGSNGTQSSGESTSALVSNGVDDDADGTTDESDERECDGDHDHDGDGDGGIGHGRGGPREAHERDDSDGGVSEHQHRGDRDGDDDADESADESADDSDTAAEAAAGDTTATP